MPFFRKVFKSKDGPRASSKAVKHAVQDMGGAVAPPRMRWEESWARKDVAPQEIQELIHICTHEMKSRALDMPLLLLPFRPNSDASAARNFVRSFFKSVSEHNMQYTGESLQQELRLTEPLVLCSIMKWCWSRLPGGVVTWEAYELFRTGESDSNFARHAFDTFIPLSVDSESRKQIIFDFFDLLAAVAARGKTNGMGGRKLSRMAGWWAFDHSDDGKGFDGGYRSWAKAADATSHLFFAYLRSLSPDSSTGISGISGLPRSLQALVSQTEYPPQAPTLMQTATTKVVMIVDSVSPTPFALLRRAKHFEYRDDDEALQGFSSYDDPVQALTDECCRVLACISRTNQSAISAEGSMPDASWSRFEDMGFSGLLDGPSLNTANDSASLPGNRDGSANLRAGSHSKTTDFGRPTTPSWADFLSSGFADENGHVPRPDLLLPPDKVLPPIGEAARIHSSQSHVRSANLQADLEPGELASITRFDLDDTFWWVWMTSLAGEETTGRKAVFGRCSMLETRIPGARWLVIEEQVKGASPGPEEGAYIAEKKGRFSFTRRGRLGRRKSTGKKPPAPPSEPYNRADSTTPMSKTSIAPDQHARIQAAAAKLAQKEKEQSHVPSHQRRARVDDAASVKTNSVLTIQPVLMSEAAPAMKWDKKYGEGANRAGGDRETIRAKYLGDISAGKGSKDNLLTIANGLSPSQVPQDGMHKEPPAPPSKNVSSSPGTRSAMAQSAGSKPPKGETSASASIPHAPTSPMLSAALDEKPIPSQSAQLNQHPALRQRFDDGKAANRSADTHAHGSSATENQSVPKKPLPKKLKKNAGAGGFRKFFGRKKATMETSPSAEGASGLQPLESDTGQGMPSLSRLSPAPSSGRPDAAAVPSPMQEPSRTVSVASHNNGQDGQASISRSSAPEHETEQAAFARFNQGPMDDVPAFVPEDGDDSAPGSEPTPNIGSDGGALEADNTGQETLSAMDDESERSLDLTHQTSPPQDRWAQIRKNAADRAARLSEEQSRRSQSQSNRTDEGETSGEETIESRVARIKARVAELTGNVDNQGARAGGRR